MRPSTPLQVIKGMQTAVGRKHYSRAFRKYFWTSISSLPFDISLRCELTGGMVMHVSTQDQAVSRKVFIDGVFEPSELSFLRKIIKPGMTVFDVGANIGVHTLTMARSLGNSGVVHAFEPSVAFSRLEKNVSLNSFENRVRLNNFALGDSEGLLNLIRCKPGNEAYTSIGKPVKEKRVTGDLFQVRMSSLDIYARENSITNIHFVKIDVEGAEPTILKGASELLKAGAIKYVMFEVNEGCLHNCGSSPAELIEYFKDNDYTVHVLGLQGELLPYTSIPTGDTMNMVASI